MAVESRIWDESFEAGADLSTKQTFLVKQDANGRIVLSAAAGDNTLGALTNDPKQNQVGAVRILGIAKITAGAAVTLGDQLISDAAGKVIPTAAAGDRIIGEALEAAGADGDIISVLLKGAYDRHA